MLPPIVHNLVMVPTHQDVIKPRPDSPPIKPAQPSEQESSVSLAYDDSKAAVESALAEQKRRRKKKPKTEAVIAQPEASVELEERPRQGSWIDIQV